MSTNSLPKRDILVVDTSSLVAHPDLIDLVTDYNIYIPIEVLEELDKLKTYQDRVGASARQVNRALDKLRQHGSLFGGANTAGGSTLYVISGSDLSVLPAGMKDIVDNRIIAVAKKAQSVFDKVTLVSEDIALRVKCDAVNVQCSDGSQFVQARDDESYLGFQHLDVSQDLIDTFYAEGEIIPEEHDLDDLYFPHEFIILKAGQSSALARVWPDGIWRKLHYAGQTKKFKVESIRPRNKEQILALELLLDPAVSMVTLTGMAGCGKTLLAIAAALHDRKSYDKIVITRPAESTSKEIGFLPGTKEEKMMPWLQPIMDNLKVLLGKHGQGYVKMMFEKGDIEVESLSYVRGRSFNNTFLIIDEAQNINQAEAKALLTRMGNNSKIVLLGDLEQIDSKRLNHRSSGLGQVVERFKEFEASGHITLLKGERSKLATYAAKNM
jgi:PhoH-like ATPase